MDDALPLRLAADLDGCFEDLVREQQDFVFGLALRMTLDRSDAEDVAQESFVRAYRALAGYDAERIRAMRLRPWLARIALNVQRNRVRRRRETTTMDDGAADRIAARGATPEEAAVTASRSAASAALLATLPEQYRVAIALRHIEGLPYAEVAEILGRPVGTVKAQIHRGLARLRTTIETTEGGRPWRERD